MPNPSDYRHLLTSQQKLYFQSEYDKQVRVPSTALILCLFLGSIGAHRFYLKQIGWGIAYLVFLPTFIPCIVALVECFLVQKRTRRYNDAIQENILRKINVIYNAEESDTPEVPRSRAEAVGNVPNHRLLQTHTAGANHSGANHGWKIAAIVCSAFCALVCLVVVFTGAYMFGASRWRHTNAGSASLSDNVDRSYANGITAVRAAVSPLPTNDPRETSNTPQSSSDVESEVSQALANWADSVQTNDPDRIASSYSEHVDRYFLKLNVDRDYVKQDKAAFVESGKRISLFKISRLLFETSTPAGAQVLLVKHYIVQSETSTLEESTTSRVLLEKSNGVWRICGERDFK